MKLQYDSESKAVCLIHLNILKIFAGPQPDFLVEDLQL